MASEAKQKLTIWVKPRTAEYIRYQSQSKGVSISEAADALLETAFRDDAKKCFKVGHFENSRYLPKPSF